MELNFFKPVFILGPGNCGYNLFSSLLDDHDELLIMPFTFSFYSKAPLILKDEKNIKNIKNYILRKTKFTIYKSGYHKLENPFRDDNNIFQDLSKFNLQIFEKNFEKFFESNLINRKNILIATYISYAIAIGKDLKKIKFFFIDSMYNDNTEEIINDFQDAKFIYLMRDPRETFLSQSHYFFNKMHSMTSIRNKPKNLYFQILKKNLSTSYNMLKKLKSNRSIDLKVVKFEDIHLNKEKIMREISNKYNFEFNKILLETTIFGNKAISVSSFSTKLISGVSENRLMRYKKKLSFLNLVLIERIFFNTIKNNNYDISYKQSTFIRILFFLSYIFPMKNELLPSRLIFKVKYKEKIKNNIYYKLLKYLSFLLWNIFSYFVVRLFVNYKLYLIRD